MECRTPLTSPLLRPVPLALEPSIQALLTNQVLQSANFGSYQQWAPQDCLASNWHAGMPNQMKILSALPHLKVNIFYLYIFGLSV